MKKSGRVGYEALTVTFPNDFELAVSTTWEELEAQVRLMAALKMFELGKLSSGKAAELAGMAPVILGGVRPLPRVNLQLLPRRP